MFIWIIFLLSCVTGSRTQVNVIHWLHEHNFHDFIEVTGKVKIITCVLGVFPSKEDSWNNPLDTVVHLCNTQISPSKPNLTNLHQVPHELIILLLCTYQNCSVFLLAKQSLLSNQIISCVIINLAVPQSSNKKGKYTQYYVVWETVNRAR